MPEINNQGLRAGQCVLMAGQQSTCTIAPAACRFCGVSARYNSLFAHIHSTYGYSSSPFQLAALDTLYLGQQPKIDDYYYDGRSRSPKRLCAQLGRYQYLPLSQEMRSAGTSWHYSHSPGAGYLALLYAQPLDVFSMLFRIAFAKVAQGPWRMRINHHAHA